MDFKKRPRTDFKPIDAISRDQARKEAAALREGVAYHDYLYYVKNQPAISDALYDKLFRRLEELEEAHPELRSPDSPTRRVGAEPVSRLKKVRHAAPMLSLQAVRETSEVEAFHRRVREAAGKRKLAYVLEPKFDGLSVELVYREGRLHHGATRGNGDVGEDISHNLKTIGAVPLSLRADGAVPESLAVRAEVFMPKSGFIDLNRERIERGEEPFANPRNAAAGLMRQLDPRNVAGKPLDIYFYEILDADGDIPDSHHDVLARLGEWGLKTSPLNRGGSSLDDLRGYHERLSGRRDDLDYEIDGTIVKVDDRALREKLGVRARNPRWAIAWKFPPREEVTTLEEIVVQVGRTGMLTPVALLQPVDVSGVTVSRATLHNADEVRRKDVRPGDRVRIVRAGDVIPEVLERVPQPGVKRARPFSMPRRCPVCGAQVEREGAYCFCPAGLSCQAQLVGRILHYASRDAMNIDHLGEKTAQQLVARDMVHDIADLYDLSIDDLELLDGFARKSATQLHAAVQDARRVRLDRFLYALGIRHVGRRIARLLATELGSLLAVRGASAERLERIPEIGTEIARSVAGFFDEKQNRRVLERLRRAGVRVADMPSRRKRQPLAGKTFVLTGSLETYTRAEAKERIEALGGRATSSVSGETDYVVVGAEPGSKRDEARHRGVRTIEEGEFLELLGED
ncbi:MAG: NAD-dependent DNA ligase LigA [Gammaproteobacteria bacterium]|nr:NAD-dependent DNA ligase LigA [Gammaproteobacteria bacterium]